MIIIDIHPRELSSVYNFTAVCANRWTPAKKIIGFERCTLATNERGKFPVRNRLFYFY